jgi:1,4-dihydroxy-2-naphthoate octaprenyltransferase
MSFIVAIPMGALSCAILAINNLRDRATDVKASKKTLPVRFGERFAKVEIGFLCLSPFLGSVYWMFVGLKWAAVLPILILPLAVRLVRKVAQTPTGPVYNQFLAQGAALHLGFGVLLSLGLVLGHIWG